MTQMSNQSDSPAAPERRRVIRRYGPLFLIAALYGVISCVGITWGLPSRKNDKYLFGEGEVWSGEKIHRLAGADEKFSAQTRSTAGADVDLNPLSVRPSSSNPQSAPPEGFAKGIPLTQTEEDVARILLRYRLYTYQPDEMITMMALAGMRPGEWDFDPRLYQYGGLFIYPVGALIRLCGLLGLINVRSDLVFYLDHPDEFGKFYIVARAYSAAWGLLGVFLVFSITRRLAIKVQDSKVKDQEASCGVAVETLATAANLAGMIAAMLFTLMPVVVCMAHEGKPHLPGAVLMLLAVHFSLRSVTSNRQSKIDNRKYFWLMCVACGAATGMVLSSWPICVLIPLVALMEWRRAHGEDRKLGARMLKVFPGALLAVATYFATNPYVLINFVSNREILRSNFGNSLAMYEIAHIGDGLVRVLELTVEGATLPMVVLGCVAAVIAVLRYRHMSQLWFVVIPAFLFFIQFVLIGAGKPDEYGRFGILTNAILGVGCASLLAYWPRKTYAVILAAIFTGVIFVWIASATTEYAMAFRRDASDRSTRLAAAQTLAALPATTVLVVPVEPAPYSCPPLPFAHRKLILATETHPALNELARIFIDPSQQPAKISWASKHITIEPIPTSGSPLTP